jgi:hypothetical protein
MAEEQPLSGRQPLRLLPPEGGEEPGRPACPATAPRGAGIATVLLATVSVYAQFAPTPQGALLFGGVAIAAIVWVYSGETQKALRQHRWNARLNFPLIAVSVILGTSIVSALNEKYVVRGPPSALLSAAPAPNPSYGVFGQNNNLLPLDQSIITMLPNSDLSLHVTDMAERLSSAQSKLDAGIQEIKNDNASRKISNAIMQDRIAQARREASANYASNLEPTETRLRAELERRTLTLSLAEPKSCQLLNSERQPAPDTVSGSQLLNQHALCLIELAKMLDQDSP